MKVKGKLRLAFYCIIKIAFYGIVKIVKLL